MKKYSTDKSELALCVQCAAAAFTVVSHKTKFIPGLSIGVYLTGLAAGIVVSDVIDYLSDEEEAEG